MFCDYCIKYGVLPEKSAFIQVCATLHIEAIKTHQASNVHVFAANKHLHEADPANAPATKAKLSLNKSLFPKLQHLFRTVHAINIKGRPLTDYLWLNELNVAKGLDIGDSYLTRHACLEFGSAIADV